MDEQQIRAVSPITLFYSYTQRDEPLRNKLEKHLSLLHRQGLISEWHDRQILAGNEWAAEIDQHLETASIILLLISSDFLASDYCYDKEMTRALERHKRGEARVIPIILRPCDWQSSPFARLQCLPRDGKAVTTWQDKDEAFLTIAQDLRQVIETWHPSSGSVESSPPLSSSSLMPVKPAPTPVQSSRSDPSLTSKMLNDLGFRGYDINGVKVILPPLCFVPEGFFWMGSDKQQDPEALDNETPQHGIVVAAFQISKYPLTVAEYNCAVKAHAVSKPPDNYVKWTDQLQRRDHPVLNVSWQDMVAYAAWLAKVTGQRWRLPTEAEWEKAARGSDDRIYPWGNEWDPKKASTAGGATTRVGSHPQGASPYGVQDMAGNVFEWTSSIYKPYPYRMDDGREDMRDTSSERVLRGGSWDSPGSRVRATYRYLNHISKHDYIIGGRLVLDEPSSSYQ